MRNARLILILCVTITVSVISAVLLLVMPNPALTPCEQRWVCERKDTTDQIHIELTGTPYFTNEAVEIDAILPNTTPGSGLRESRNRVYVTGWSPADYTCTLWIGSVAYMDVVKYHGEGVFEYNCNEYRVTLLKGGNALQIGDDVLELKPSDKVEIVFTTPDEYTITINGEEVVQRGAAPIETSSQNKASSNGYAQPSENE